MAWGESYGEEWPGLRRGGLTLGQANVMLSYPIDEAEELLSTKLKAAKTSLSNCEEDLDFLREQITVSWVGSGLTTLVANTFLVQTMEVAVARVYNWDVVQKRKEKDEEEKQENTRKGKDGAPGG